MKTNIEFSKEQYQELLELVFLGEQLKTMNIVPESYEHIINLPSTKLRNYIFSQAKQFDSEDLIEHHQEMQDQFFLKTGDDLLEEYLDM